MGERKGLFTVLYDTIYLSTAIGLTPGGSSTVQYTLTHKQYIDLHKYKEYIEQHK